jgi:acetyl esterase/lipase
MEKRDGSHYACAAFFSVGQNGLLDLSRHAPISGDWSEPDAMAPVWSMRHIRAASAPAKSAEPDDITIHLTLTDSSSTVHHASFIQTFFAPGVTRRQIDYPGLVGTVFSPAAPGPHPVILGLNGSNGGMPLERCALYAANGYIAVALAFFGAPGLPEYFGATRLEYFETALTWIKKTLHPKDDFIAVAGSSRGGELAMLLGSYFPEHIHAVIGFVPSAVVNGIQQAGFPGEPRDALAWTYKGASIPNLWRGNPDADIEGYSKPEIPDTPIRQSRVFMTALGSECSTC